MNQNELIVWLRALGEEHRLAVVLLLRGAGPCAGHHILEALPDLTQPGLSRHLSILREAGIVSGRKQGREILYRVRETPLLREVLGVLAGAPAPQHINQIEYDVPGETVIDPTPEDDFQDWLR